MMALFFYFIMFIVIPLHPLFSQMAPESGAAQTQQFQSVESQIPPHATMSQPPIAEATTQSASTPGGVDPSLQQIKQEQLTWPDTVTFSENQNDTSSITSPEIINLFKQANDICNEMNTVIGSLNIHRSDLYQKFFEVAIALDDFWQTSSTQMGALENNIPPIDTENSAQPEAIQQDPQSNVFKQEINNINGLIQTVSQNKESIKKILSSIDTDIERGKIELLEARQHSMNILQKPAAEGAFINNDLNQKLNGLKNIEKKIIEITIPEFKNLYQQMQTLIKKITDRIQSLQTQEASVKQKNNNPQNNVLSQEMPKPLEQTDISEKQLDLIPQSKETFIHYIVHRIAQIITGAGNILYTTYNKTKDTLFKPQETHKPAATQEQS